MPNKGTFATKDIHLAAFLRLKGMLIEKVIRPEGRGLVEFVFSDKEECDRLNMEWVNDEAEGNISEYVVQLMKLKKSC